MIKNPRLYWSILAILVFIWSGFSPKDRLTWWLEVSPSIIAALLIAWNWKKFPLSVWLFAWIAIHSCILCIGGKYTYAEVPAGFWVKDFFDLSRNHYDRLGHFVQGFVPAFLAREIFIRKKVMPDNAWMKLFVISVCLAFSAFYEIIEFAVGVAIDQSSEAFLGTQGDAWDTQKDMLLALIGASAALLLSRFHDRSIEKVR